MEHKTGLRINLPALGKSQQIDCKRRVFRRVKQDVHRIAVLSQLLK